MPALEVGNRNTDIVCLWEAKSQPQIPKQLGESMTDLIERAERFARVCHAGQCRKGAAKEPYTIHLEEVSSLVEAWAILDMQGDALQHENTKQLTVL